jgi:hypothetical protein
MTTNSVYSPRGSVHGFKNDTDQPIRVFINIAPAGFEHFFAEAAEEWVKPEPDMNRIATIADKYGLHDADASYETQSDLTLVSKLVLVGRILAQAFRSAISLRICRI